MRTLCLGLLAAASVLFGQIDSNSITVTASRSVYLPPDQLVIAVTVSSPLTATLDDIVAVLQGSGITAANLSGSSSSSTGLIQAFWSFTLSRPFENMKDTIASLTALQQTIPQKNTGIGLTFRIQGTRVSAQLQESQCVVADLVSDARAQAQKLAAVAGLTLGPILAISDGPFVANASYTVLNPFLSIIPANRLAPTAILKLTPISISTPALTCSIVVKFSLLRYQ